MPKSKPKYESPAPDRPPLGQLAEERHAAYHPEEHEPAKKKPAARAKRTRAKANKPAAPAASAAKPTEPATSPVTNDQKETS